MFSKSARLYDLIYGQFKDYAEESRRIAALLERLHPEAETVLDVGCGTGEHARFLREAHGYRVDGVDLEPECVRIAAEKCPEGRFVCGDMTTFVLERRYDAVLCLFSSIGYSRSLDGVGRALARFREHLAPGGVVVVEPWIEPDAWQEGRVHMHTAESDEEKVCRMGHASRYGKVSVLTFHYLLGRESGIEHFTEVHEMGLFTREELESGFREASLEVVEYDPEGLIGRGLFVARAAE